MDDYKMRRANTSELWRALDELDYFIAISLDNGYAGSFMSYAQQSLRVIAFMKAKPFYEKEEFKHRLENIATLCRIEGNEEMEQDYLDKSAFFTREIMKSK